MPDEVAVAPKPPPEKKNAKAKKAKDLADDDADGECVEPSKKKQPKEKRKKKLSDKEKENTGSEASDPDAGKRSKEAKEEAKKEEEEEMPRCVFKPLPANWWGARYFVSAGAMVGLEQSEEAKKRQEFTEDSQEALYTRAQNTKVAGRQGLGVRGSKIKIAGGDYEGKKIAFGEDKAEGDSDGDSEDDNEATDAINRIKWKKLIAKTLKGEESGSMKVKKLQKRVAAAAQKQLDSKIDSERLEGVVLKKLKSSSRFTVDGKVARCC